MTDQPQRTSSRRTRLVAGGAAVVAVAAIAVVGVAAALNLGDDPTIVDEVVVQSAPSGPPPNVSVEIFANPAEAEPSSTSETTDPPTPSTSSTEVAIPVLSVPAAAPEQAPAFVVLENGRVFIRGTAPDRETADGLVEQAAAFGNGEVTDELLIAPGSPVGSNLPLFVPDAALFEPDSANLAAGAAPVLAVLAGAMKQLPDTSLLIRGHTDDQGSDAYNFALSQQRVAAVFAFLDDAGIDGGRMTLEPRGETEPLADNSTSEGRSRNRRVELVLVGT